MLTNSDLKQILDALARYGKKDSQLDAVPIDLEHPEGTFTTNDYLSIVQDGKNKTIKIKNLEKVFLLTFLTDEDFREALKGRIPGEMLENASVTTEKLADGSITTIKLGDSSVTNAKLSDNAVTSSKLADNSVTTSKIVDESITTSKLNTNAVTTNKLADGSVTTDKIANGAVTSSKIADNSLSGANFGNNTIEGTKIKDNSIPGSKLADGAIESIDIKDGTLSGSKLADNSVTGAKLQDSVITGMKIADNSIPGSKIADSTIQNLNIANNSISGSKLVDNAITTDKIANGAINSAKLTNDAITENKIADDSVTTNKIADRAVTNSKLANNSVTSDKIADNSVTSSMITDYAVTENKLDSGSITASKIAPNAVTTTKLGDNAITSDKIVDGSVTEQKLADNSVTTDKIDTDAVTNVKIADNAVTESKIATNAVTTTKIVDSSVTTVKIADNTVTTIKLADGAVTEEKLADGAVTTAKLADGLISEIQNITDVTPTEGSVKPIQSGGVQVALMNRAIVGDIVGDPAQAWEPGTAEAYIDQKIAEQNAVLNAKMSRQDAVIHALNGQDIVLVSALPQTGEANKIYRLTGTDSYTDYMWDTSLATPAFTAIATYSFPGIDADPTAGSDNLVKSKGVFNLVQPLIVEVDGEEEIEFNISSVNTICFITSANTWLVNNTNSTGDIIAVSDYRGRTIKIVANATDSTYYAFVSAAPVAGSSVAYCQGYARTTMNAGESKDVVIPNDAAYLWFSKRSYAHDFTPQSIKLVGVIGLKEKCEDVGVLKKEIDGVDGKSINPSDVVSVNCFITSSNQWLVGNTNNNGKIVEIIAGRTIKIVANGTSNATVAFTRGDTPVASGNVDYATGETGRRTILKGQELVTIIPSDAVYLWFSTNVYSNDTTPASIEILPIDGMAKKINDAVADVAELQNKKLDVSVGKNKYSNPSLVAGYFLTSNGSFTANASRSYSDFIQLKAETTYHISAHNDSPLDDNSNIYYVYYDVNKNYIGSTPAPTKTITTPTGTAYIRLSGYSSKFEQNVQIELGSERTDYEQYSPIGGYITMPDVVSDFNPLIGKKVLCLGDSITEFVGEGDKGYPNYLADMSNANVLKAGVGGSWLTARRTPVDTPTSVNEARAAFDVYNLVNAWLSNDFTQVDAANAYLIGEGDDNTSQVNVLKNNAIDSVDVVTIFAGTNDFNNGVDIGTNTDNALNTICGAYRNIISSLCSANKSLRIFIFTPIVRYFTNERTDANWSDNYQNADGKTLRDYADAIVSVANNEHIAACNLYDTLGWNKYNFSNYFLDNDGTHPYKGFEPLARRIYSFICSNY